ncbi:MAG: hypothetical protein ABIO40_08555 [Devosia sp.]
MTSDRGKSLIIVAAGDKSVHEQSFSADEFTDLWIIYYGLDDNVAARYAAGSTRLWRHQGYKFDLVRNLLHELVFGEKFDFCQYEYVFLPDDDIVLPGGMAALHELFSIGRGLGLDAFQPAIQNNYYSHKSTLRVEGDLVHEVTWPEIMMPVYESRSFVRGFLAALHLFDFSATGWRIEYAAARLAEMELGRKIRCAVIDAVPAIHTRPTGTDGAMYRRAKIEAFLKLHAHDRPMRTLRHVRIGEALVAWPDERPSPPDPKRTAKLIRFGHYQRKWAALGRVRFFRRLVDLVSGPPPSA